MRKRSVCVTLILSWFLCTAYAFSEIVLVDGKQHGVVVIADNALPVAVQAAEELVWHIQKASGTTLPVVRESEAQAGDGTRVFLGATKALTAQGIDLASLRPEEFVIFTRGKDIYIAGEEGKEDPFNQRNSKCGTLFGVYELLERSVGVRWIWPGELGTYIPAKSRIAVATIDERIAPKLAFREIGWGRINSLTFNKRAKLSEQERIMSFSHSSIKQYGQELKCYLRRHRMGGLDRRPRAGHFFTNWWEKYGKEHPEWFMLKEDGTRGPDKRATQSPMCVSNPELHRFIIEQWDGKREIMLGDVDWPDSCRCPNCMAWTAPQPPEPLPEILVSSIERGLPESKLRQEARGHELHGFYKPMCVSDRYARFWKSVQQLAAAKNPDALVTVSLYYAFFPAPTDDLNLGPHIYGQFVPWGNPQHTDFFPMRAESLEWLKEQWLGWRKTGIRIAYRPNYLHDGWVMPLVETAQSGDFIRFAVTNGMEGAYFDTLTGQWATQGPKLYMHMRLLAKPELEVSQILDEYYEAFGPAATKVRAYFEYWEQYCRDNLQRINDLYIDHGHRWPRFQLMAHEAFPLESFAPAEQLLAQADRAVRDSTQTEFAERVNFLRNGLIHARLARNLAACFAGEYQIPAGSERFDRGVDALRELIAFRHTHETPCISDYLYGASWRELRFWSLKPLLEQIYGKDIIVFNEEDTRAQLP